MSTASQQEQGKKGSDAPRSASKRKASGSHCPQGKGHRRRSKETRSELTITNPDAAGIDVGARTHYVAVPEGRAEVSVRSFGTYTVQLDQLVNVVRNPAAWQCSLRLMPIKIPAATVSAIRNAISPHPMFKGISTKCLEDRIYCSL